MVELCNAERLGWMGMTIATAITAGTPWLHSCFEHGKLRTGAVKSRKARSLSALLQITVPKRLFTHFYLLCVVTCAVVFLDLFFYGGSLFTARIQSNSACSRVAARSERVAEMEAEGLLCLLLLAIHAARRLWECVAVTAWGSSRMSLIAYVVGVVHYLLMILTMLVEAPPLGRLAGEAGSDWGRVLVTTAESVNLRHSAALAMFVVGSVHQHEAIVHLATLRKSQVTTSTATTTTYSIPTKGWFQYVSCPHYFAELLIYAAFVVLGGFKGRGLGQGYLVAFSWVFANQSLVAGRAHAWYLQKFEGYPRGRKRLIPGVW